PPGELDVGRRARRRLVVGSDAGAPRPPAGAITAHLRRAGGARPPGPPAGLRGPDRAGTPGRRGVRARPPDPAAGRVAADLPRLRPRDRGRGRGGPGGGG